MKFHLTLFDKKADTMKVWYGTFEQQLESCLGILIRGHKLNKKINLEPKTKEELIKNLNKSYEEDLKNFPDLDVVIRISTQEDIEKSKKQGWYYILGKGKFKENQTVYYILYCYHQDKAVPIPEVIAYEWHEVLKDYFNENLLFGNKEEAMKVRDMLHNSILYPVDKSEY